MASGIYQIQGKFNLGQVGVSENLVSDWVVGILNAMKIVRHEIDPIDVGLHILEFKVAKILV